MTTTMREQKVTKTTKLKAAVLSVLAASAIGSSAFALGNMTQPSVTNAAASNAPQHQAIVSPDQQSTFDNGAGIANAIDYYAYQQAQASGSAFSRQNVHAVQVSAMNARARVGTDGGYVAYLHYTTPQVSGENGTWSVVYAGQTPISAEQAAQYGMPNEWAQPGSW